MPIDPFLTTSGLVIALSATGLVYWVVVLVRIARSVRTVPTARAGLDEPAPASGWPKVSVIVPIHNEERVIERCVQSLQAQEYGNLEIILVLDRCTDATAKLVAPLAAADDRITVLVNDACPADWAGKCNAARVGADRATGDWLLFTDADTRFDPVLLRATVALSSARGLDLLSLLSTLTNSHWFERVVQPVAAISLMRMYPIDRVNRATGARPFANGQFMLFSREIYDRIGGHEAVKDDLLEDIAFSRLVKHAGGRGGLVLGDGLLVCSMYDSAEAFEMGWKRIFIEACKRKPKRLRKNAMRAWCAGVGLPVVQLATLVVGVLAWREGDDLLALTAGLVLGASVIAQAWALAWAYRMAGQSARAAILFPLGSWIVGRIMWRAASDLAAQRPIRWGGREYVLDPR